MYFPTDFNLPFVFRNQAFTGKAIIDFTDAPFYVFVILKDGRLVGEFGDEITIKTDGVNRLAKSDDYSELVQLRQAIFNSIKLLPEFQAYSAFSWHA